MKTGSKKGVKAPRRPGAETTKVNLTLGVEQYRRLFVTSVMAGQTASAIVDSLIAEHLKSWSMPADLSARVKSSDRAEAASQVTESESKAA